jgi:hypothetical protein
MRELNEGEMRKVQGGGAFCDLVGFYLGMGDLTLAGAAKAAATVATTAVAVNAAGVVTIAGAAVTAYCSLS